MPLPAVPNFIKVNFKFSIGTNSNVSSHLFFHYTTGSIDDSLLTPTATAIAAAWGTNLKPWHHAQVSLDLVEVEDLGVPGSLPGSASGPGPGSRSGDMPFADVAVLINFHIPRRYRGGKPRVYMPLLNAADISAPNQWNATILGNLQTAWRAFITACHSLTGPALNPMDHSAISYISGGSVRPTPLTDIVTLSVCSPIPGSQRRRMGR